MSKQDRQPVRTAAQLEEKYNFRKSFAEVMGVAESAVEAAAAARDTADSANEKIFTLQTHMSRDSEEIKLLAEKTEALSASVNNEIQTLTRRVEEKVTAEEVSITVKSEMAKGASKVVTESGFRFNEEGLDISKTGSEMKTRIADEGMTVFQNDKEVLLANNKGVAAKNLHATTYLIIGANSRLEDYGERTGCFWIGG